jgi:hypothetical protein
MGSTFQQSAHAVLSRLHVKLQCKNALAYRKRLSLSYFALGAQHCPARQIECLAVPVKWRKVIGDAIIGWWWDPRVPVR